MVKPIDEKEFNVVWDEQTGDENSEFVYRGCGYTYSDTQISVLKNDKAFKGLKAKILKIESVLGTELMFHCKKTDDSTKLYFVYKNTKLNYNYIDLILLVLRHYAKGTYGELKGKNITGKKFIDKNVKPEHGFGNVFGTEIACPLF